MTRAAPWARATRQAAVRGRTGGDAVVHHDGGPPGQRQAGAFAPVEPGPPLQLVTLALLHHRQVVGADPRPSHHVLGEDPDAVLADGAHGQLRLDRDPELAHDDGVQGRPQRPGDLGRHHHPAARQAQHHRVLVAQVPEDRRQLPAGCDPIIEGHRPILAERAAPVDRVPEGSWVQGHARGSR